ncbi:UV-damage endonuclease [Abditibacterium utsteinense]|uniref:UV-damage endonuclease n=1 Tax=Abditibacterium utsteinense TaxID=1960156 RepID=A0A2S8SXM7_9BACT|nr:UV DNA damage repair endonuclease UvsE [Abditibacterium utsteinense]PQV65551.1 UV-damage endonuclease [Abditibacterium utsteinense]
MRLGFAVKVLGQEGLKSHDARRHANNPHLKNSIEFAHGIFDYLEKAKISMYRFSSDFAPYLTHPDMPQFHNQIEEARPELELLGKRARDMNLRLSFHPSQYIILNSPSEKLTETSTRDFLAQANMLDVMEQPDEAVIVTHVGGVYGDRAASMARFAEHFHALPEAARRRLVLENDDVSYSAADVLKIHEQTGIRCIFDHQHHSCINPEDWAPEAACAAILKTWPQNCRPKIHFSSPRIEDREILRRDRTTGKKVAFKAAPLASQHADYIDAETFIPFAREVQKTREFDVMCEAKAKDLAVLQLREALEKAGGFVME